MGTTSCRGILHGTATPYRQSTISEPTRYILILRTVKCSRRKEVPDEARLQPQEVLLSMACGELRQKLNKKLTNLKIFSIYLNKYSLSKMKLYFVFNIRGFATHPSSFIGIKEPKELYF